MSAEERETIGYEPKPTGPYVPPKKDEIKEFDKFKIGSTVDPNQGFQRTAKKLEQPILTTTERLKIQWEAAAKKQAAEKKKMLQGSATSKKSVERIEFLGIPLKEGPTPPQEHLEPNGYGVANDNLRRPLYRANQKPARRKWALWSRICR